MILLIYLSVFYFFVNFRKPFSPSLVLVTIYASTLVCAILIGNDYEFDSFFKIFNLFFLTIVLSLFLYPWRKFSYNVSIISPKPQKIQKLTIILLLLNAFNFKLFVTAIYHASTTVIDYSAFKNGGESEGFITQIGINHTQYMVALYSYPTAYFLVPLHLHLLISKRYLLSFLCFIFSLNIILYGLTVFSRSGFMAYFFLYLFYIPFFYGKFSLKTRSVLNVILITCLCSASLVFYEITSNRMANVVSYKEAVNSQSLVSSPEAYSILDYLSQWYKNSNELMSRYSFDTFNGLLSIPFFLALGHKFGLSAQPGNMIVSDALFKMWGADLYYLFNGLIAYLLYDYGYIGTILFVLFYNFILFKLRPFSEQISITRLLMLGTLFNLPAMGIFSSELATGGYNLLIIYSIVLYLYLTLK